MQCIDMCVIKSNVCPLAHLDSTGHCHYKFSAIARHLQWGAVGGNMCREATREGLITFPRDIVNKGLMLCGSWCKKENAEGPNARSANIAHH